MRRGGEAEGRMWSLHDIGVRKNGSAEEPVHIVLSPPQEWALKMMQLPDTYRKMYDKVLRMLKTCGIHSGAVVFHPWRLDDDCKNWRAGPHFHIIGYGWLDSVKLYKKTKWIAEKIHPKEPIRSVRLWRILHKARDLELCPSAASSPLHFELLEWLISSVHGIVAVSLFRFTKCVCQLFLLCFCHLFLDSFEDESSERAQ